MPDINREYHDCLDSTKYLCASLDNFTLTLVFPSFPTWVRVSLLIRAFVLYRVACDPSKPRYRCLSHLNMCKVPDKGLCSWYTIPVVPKSSLLSALTVFSCLASQMSFLPRNCVPNLPPHATIHTLRWARLVVFEPQRVIDCLVEVNALPTRIVPRLYTVCAVSFISSDYISCFRRLSPFCWFYKSCST